MALLETLRSRALAAMKARDTVTTTILRLAQSEVQAAELRAGRPLTDDEGFAVVRKLLKSNEETLAAGAGDAQRAATLAREITILTELLPRALTATQLEALLGPVATAIRAAASDGQATGVAMKHLKSTGVSASGADVALAVKALRS